jgi:hypothetical protein
MKFIQTSGTGDNLSGFAVFYTPVISENGMYRSITGFDMKKMIEESMRMISHWDVFEKSFNCYDNNFGYFFNFFDNEAHLRKVTEGKEWDVFVNNDERYLIEDKRDLLNLNSILSDGIHQYMKDYLRQKTMSLDNLEKMNESSIPEDFNLDDVLPDWYRQ